MSLICSGLLSYIISKIFCLIYFVSKEKKKEAHFLRFMLSLKINAKGKRILLLKVHKREKSSNFISIALEPNQNQESGNNNIFEKMLLLFSAAHNLQLFITTTKMHLSALEELCTLVFKNQTVSNRFTTVKCMQHIQNTHNSKRSNIFQKQQDTKQWSRV